MKTFRVLNDKGDIEVKILKRANVVFKTNEYNETEDVCMHKETINIYDLVSNYEKLQQENKQLKSILKSKPDTEITLQDDKGNKFILIQSERIDMQEKLNKTIERLFNNWNKLREWIVYNKHNENTEQHYLVVDYGTLLGKMQELEQGSDK